MNTTEPFDLEATPITGQDSIAVLALDGGIIRGDLPESDATILYQMLLEASALDDARSFRRMTVTSGNHHYLVVRDENFVYISRCKTS